MAPAETPEQIMHTRTVTADTVLSNRVDLRGYPYRLLTVVANRGIGAHQMTQAVAAAEVLEALGWELVTISEIGNSQLLYAVVRRR
ncbi:transcriptional regulator [Melissospora conviva]|uniref:transcriptional regulator n=1 Tax=Melissospora conviva TaxID=3388432 RepID=UPI003B75D406